MIILNTPDRNVCSNAFAVRHVKARWKGLRNTFRRAFKARNPVPKSEAGIDYDDVDEDVLKKWVFYESLLFLKDSATSRAQVF